MAKITKIEIQLSKGQTLSLSESEAQELYNALKHIYETKIVYLPSPHYPEPYRPVWTTESTGPNI